MEKWDAIIVGSGLGALVSGALLAKEGKKVILLERRSNIGGRATTRDVQGFKIDYGVHLMTVGHLQTVLDKINAEIDFTYTDAPAYIYHNNKFIGIPNRLADYHNFEYVPAAERNDLIGLLEEVKSMPFEDLEDYDFMSLKDWLDIKVTSETARSFISLIANAFLSTENEVDMSAGAALRCIRRAFRNDGPWFGYPKEGGFNTIGLTLAETITKNGGQIQTGVLVREILVNNGVVSGIAAESPNGLLRLEAPIVISNVPLVNIFSLVSTDVFPRWFVERVHFLQRCLYHSSSSSVGLSFISTKPLYNLKSIAAVPAVSPVNRSGPSSVRWIYQPTNLTPSIAPQERHIFGYGTIVSRDYGDFLKDNKPILAKEIKALEKELWQLFPDFDRCLILQPRFGLIPVTDTSLQFPGNSWR